MAIAPTPTLPEFPAQDLIMEKLLQLPVLASKHGKDVDNLIIYVHLLMIALFIGWLAYFIYVLVRFRESRQKRADYVGFRGHASTWIEGAVAVIEGVLLIGFAIPLWAKVVDEPPSEGTATTIRVVAQQFGWNMLYPGTNGVFGRQDMALANSENRFGKDKNDPNGKDDFEMLNEMHVVVNKPVLVSLTSMDVVHSFKVLALRVTQDAIPGMRIPTWFVPTREGKYQINCAQLCGVGHAGMAQGMIYVENQEKFDQWVKEKSAGAGGGATGFE
jgi:cytochrome c oxidase subunit 2